MSKKILDYLFNLEFCSPPTLSGFKIYDEESEMKFPIIPSVEKVKNEKMKTIYTVYIGAFYYKEKLIELQEKFNVDKESTSSNKSCSILCGFKIDEDGEYIPSTFAIPEFLYAIITLIHQDIEKDIHFSIDDFKVLKEKLETSLKLSTLNGILTKDKLNNIYNDLVTELKELQVFLEYDVKIIKEEVYREAEEISPALLPSFYLKDISMIKGENNKKINKLLSLKHDKTIEISKDDKEIIKVINPKLSPLGKWPCVFRPSLMQQVAINLSLNNDDSIFSINGPPGTGKTTLVKEIIADLIVRRAEKMSHFDNPDDAFKRKDIPYPIDTYNTCFYEMDDSLKGYGILVSSNNNTAVENITLELPDAKDVSKEKALTSLFDVSESEEIYFTELANEINCNRKNWGLISVRLGKKENIKKFLTPLWFNKDGPTFSSYCSNTISLYSSQKEKFCKKLGEVKNYQKHLMDAYKIFQESLTIGDKIRRKELEIAKENEKIKDIKNKISNIQKEISIKEKSINRYTKLIKEALRYAPFYIRLLPFLFLIYEAVKERKDLAIKVQELSKKSIEFKKEIIQEEEIINVRDLEILKLNNELDDLKKSENDIKDKLKIYTEEDGITIPTPKDLENIDTNVEVQTSSYFTNDKFDILREELFFEALMLHKSFILNSNAFRNNLCLLVNMLNANNYRNIKQKYFKELIHDLFLFVPVISTTLASVERFLDNIPKDEIGYLILDEAGQATPGSVLGAIYRSKKSIILGDPLQIEPVVNIPKELYKILDSKNQLPNLYHINTLSAQIIADLQNDYGEIRSNNNWIGCPLLIHRRCQNPMFSISNDIAYDGKMFSKTKKSDKKRLIFKESCWLDIGGSEISKENHYVEKQGKKVIEFVEAGINIQEDLPKLYIITPFKTVAEEMKKKLEHELNSKYHFYKKDIKEWVVTHCGTIHTFQGKETDEVILLLGCSSESNGAIRWAGQTPNILNVAVTRAKYRIVIIGDVRLWKDIPYFSTAYKYLKEKIKK